jgi:peptidoglycan/xylan/chitin deacetylase (PgdA/CDA1 family)
MKSELTIVMYHYVREVERSRYPRIKALHTDQFRRQLEHVRRNFTLVSMAQVAHAIRTRDPLPPKAALLTFDDGYIEHFTTIFPILFDARVPGAFFPSVATAKRGMLLDVNRVHFILAMCNAFALGEEIDAAVKESREKYNLKSPEDFRRAWFKPNRFDTAEVIYVKRMLQVALPESLRNEITQTLFARHVSCDERAFASELYATLEQFRVMQASGMYVGAHGDSHYWLNHYEEEVQRHEIVESLKFLRDVGSPVDEYWVMCYPYGAWDEKLLHVLREFRCSAGLTTHVGTALVGENEPLLLPRLDTNDLPR